MRAPSPMTAPASTTASAPISTPCPSLASGDTTALGCTPGWPCGRVRAARTATVGSRLAQRRSDDDAGGPRGRELGLVARVGEEADAVLVGLVQRRNASDQYIGDAGAGPTKQIAAQGGDQLGKRDGRA